MSTHADAAMEALQQTFGLGPVAAAVRELQAAQIALREEADIVGIVGASARVIQALEALAKVAGDLVAEFRPKLAEVMQEIGCEAAACGDDHVVGLAEGKRGVIITDPAAVPRELWTTPEPSPDKKLIAKALTKGPVPGATLTNTPPRHLVIRPARKTAA